MTEIPKLTTEEIQMLLAGMDAFDATLLTPSRAEQASTYLEAMTMPGGFGVSPEAVEAKLSKSKAEITERLKTDTLKREQVVMLKAKLLGLRDKAEVSDIDLSSDENIRKAGS